MTFALIAAVQQADPPHSTAPWYFAIPAIVIVLGLAMWRRRGEGAAGRLAAPGINDEPGRYHPQCT